MKNTVINTAIWVTRISMGVVLLIYFAFGGFILYWHINPEYFDQWYLVDAFKPGTIQFTLQRSGAENGMTFNELGRTNIYWILIRTGLGTYLVLHGLRLISKILHSVNSKATFYTQNVKLFHQLAITGILFGVLSFFNFSIIDGQSQFLVSIPFSPLLFAMACYVMAEIFKEGNRLQEDANSII